jgi:hypothetical protein
MYQVYTYLKKLGFILVSLNKELNRTDVIENSKEHWIQKTSWPLLDASLYLTVGK